MSLSHIECRYNDGMLKPTLSSYRVRLTPLPTVIDDDDQAIAGTHVVEIVFPGQTIETRLGPVNTIIGAGVAKILVGETTIRGVPLC